MTRKIEEIQTADAENAAVSLDLSGKSFIIANETSNATLYFRDCTDDSTDASSSNGFPVAAGATLPFVLRGGTLSFYGAKAKILIVGEV